jgi:GNAT superfamily N-acetyltransferase
MSAIRHATDADLDAFYGIATAMGATHEADYFERCLQEMRDGNRAILVLEDAGALCGYIQLIWKPLYQPFRKLDIPEIQDLNVIPAARRQGFGEKLVDACEALVRNAGKSAIGIGVGLHASFGAAQRLYVRKGYIPDGAGVAYDDEAVRAYDVRPVDDLLTLKLVKELR